MRFRALFRSASRVLICMIRLRTAKCVQSDIFLSTFQRRNRQNNGSIPMRHVIVTLAPPPARALATLQKLRRLHCLQMRVNRTLVFALFTTYFDGIKVKLFRIGFCSAQSLINSRARAWERKVTIRARAALVSNLECKLELVFLAATARAYRNSANLIYGDRLTDSMP